MVVAEIPDSLAESRRLPTVTLEGWREFIDAKPATPTLLDPAQYAGLSRRARQNYNDQRLSYHSELVIVETSSVREVLRQGRLLMLLNRREIGARRSLIVDGPWGSGKSTNIKWLGRTHEHWVRKHYPRSDRIPVVYITTPPKGSPRKLASEFAHFLGLPDRPRLNTTDITDAVSHVMTQALTDLVLVDEIHNLNLATSAGEDMSDHLKYFTEHIPATFVFAGINVERSGLFTGVRGHQISARSVLVHTGPFPYGDEWQALIASMEAALRLYKHRPGTLVRNAKYLHQRTGGSISSLSQLVRTAAITAILTATEAITRDLLDTTSIDHAAETTTPQPRAQTAR